MLTQDEISAYVARCITPLVRELERKQDEAIDRFIEKWYKEEKNENEKD